jgi:hypothetical protein
VRPLNCLLALAAVSLTTAATGAHASSTLSLIVSSEEGMFAPDVDRIEGAFRKHLTAGDVVVQPREETMAHFAEARELGIDCRENDFDCAAKIGVIAGADRVLLVTAAAKGDRFLLRLLLVDVSAKEGARRITRWIPATGDGFELAVQESAAELFAPAIAPGALHIRVSPAGAAIFIDGERAPAPDAKGLIAGVPAGRRFVEVRLRGHRTFKKDVVVQSGKTSELTVTLAPGADPTPAAARPAPAPAPKGAPVDRMTAAWVTVGTSAALVLPTIACCGLCGCVGFAAPPVCGAVGGGAGAYLGSLLATGEWDTGLLPALVGALIGAGGGVVGGVGGLLLAFWTAPLLGVSAATWGFGLLTTGVTPPGLGAVGLMLAPVVVVALVSAAIAGVGTNYMLPEELPASPKRTERRRTTGPPLREPVARAMAF